MTKEIQKINVMDIQVWQMLYFHSNIQPRGVKLHRKFIVSDLVSLFQLTDCLVFHEKAQPMFIDIDSQLVVN